MKISQALMGIAGRYAYGASVPEVFKVFTLDDFRQLIDWVVEIENAESQNVEIDMSKAPQWFCHLVRGQRINSIKDIRDHFRDYNDKSVTLVSSKHFVERMTECIVAPSRPLLTSA